MDVRRRAWPVVLAGVAVAWAVIVAVLLGLAVQRALHPAEPRCDRSGTCTGLTAEQIAQVARMPLPPGTEVVESEYAQFQDWYLRAVIRLPPSAASPFLSPEVLSRYTYEPGAASGTSRSQEETLRAAGCYQIRGFAGGPDVNGVFYRAAEGMGPDGRLMVALQVFTT